MTVQWIVDLNNNLKGIAPAFLVLFTLFTIGCVIFFGCRMIFAKTKEDKKSAINTMIHIIVSFVIVVVICIVLFSVLSYMATGKFSAWVRSFPLFN